MAAVPLFRDTNMTAVISCENTIKGLSVLVINYLFLNGGSKNIQRCFCFCEQTSISLNKPNKGVQGWRSGESTRLPPMWPGFDSRTRRHMWVEFVGSLLCTERFSPGTPVTPLLKNQHLT